MLKHTFFPFHFEGKKISFQVYILVLLFQIGRKVLSLQQLIYRQIAFVIDFIQYTFTN